MGHRTYTNRKRVLSFDVDGDHFYLKGKLSLFDLEQFDAEFGNLDADTAEGLAALGTIFDQLLGDEEGPRFRAYCGEHHLSGETILEILMDAIGDVVGTPSQRPSDSSGGPPSTERTSTVISLSRGTVLQMPLTPEREAELRQAVDKAAAEEERASA